MLEKLTSAEAQKIIVVLGTEEETLSRYATAVKTAYAMLAKRGAFVPEWKSEYVRTIIQTVASLSGDERADRILWASEALYFWMQDIAPEGTFFGEAESGSNDHRYRERYW